MVHANSALPSSNFFQECAHGKDRDAFEGVQAKEMPVAGYDVRSPAGSCQAQEDVVGGISAMAETASRTSTCSAKVRRSSSISEISSTASPNFE